MKKIKKRFYNILHNKRGEESYIDAVIAIIIFTMLLIVIMNAFTAIFSKQNLDYFSKEMAKTAAVNGTTDITYDDPSDHFMYPTIQSRFDELIKETGFDESKIKITWSCPTTTVKDENGLDVKEGGYFGDNANNKYQVQYGNQLKITVTYDQEISGFSGNVFGGTHSSSYSALSQIYWKAGE